MPDTGFIPHIIYGGTERIKIIEQYLQKYCSDTLSLLSLQNSDKNYTVFEDAQKQLTSVKILKIENCHFGKEFTFQKVFPNLETLELGFNEYNNISFVVTNLHTVKHLTCIFRKRQFRSEDIQELFKLNPQLENPKINLTSEYGSDLFSHLKAQCSSLQECHFKYSRPFEYYTFLRDFNHFDKSKREIYRKISSEKYKKDLVKLFVLYEKHIYGITNGQWNPNYPYLSQRYFSRNSFWPHLKMIFLAAMLSTNCH